MAMTKTQRRRVTSAIRYAVLIFWGITAAFPIYWMVITSFKPDYHAIPSSSSATGTVWAPGKWAISS